MKSIITLLVLITVLFSSCNRDSITYAEELKAEQELIADFLSRQNIQVVNTMPLSFPWPENVYFKSKTGLYFRLEDQGDINEGDSVATGDLIITRFIQYTLKEKSDTIFNETTIDFPYPTTFRYKNLSEGCAGWHEAVGYMKYSNARAKLIVYSKLGFKEFNNPATPIAYDMFIKIQKN